MGSPFPEVRTRGVPLLYRTMSSVMTALDTQYNNNDEWFKLCNLCVCIELLLVSASRYLYIYVCVCMCVCVNNVFIYYRSTFLTVVARYKCTDFNINLS